MNNRAAYPQCPQCQYNLTGLPDNVRCPECGTAIDWYLAWRRPPRFRPGQVRLTVQLFGTLAAIWVQVFILSGSYAWLAILGTINGTSMDHVFRRMYNTVTLIQAVGAIATLLLIAALWGRQPGIGGQARMLTTLAATSSLGGVLGRLWLFEWRVSLWFLFDLSLALMCGVVYYVTRRTISEWRAERDKRLLMPAPSVPRESEER